MRWLRRHAWWGLLAASILVGLLGLGDLLAGAAFEPTRPVAVTGLTLTELEAESAAAYRLIDYGARDGGLDLIVIGLLLSIIVLIPFRAGQRWAWWTMWTLVAWLLVAPAVTLTFGLAPGQGLSGAALSGPVIAVIVVGLLLVTVPRGSAPA